jgi:hypothetical protein
MMQLAVYSARSPEKCRADRPEEANVTGAVERKRCRGIAANKLPPFKSHLNAAAYGTRSKECMCPAKLAELANQLDFSGLRHAIFPEEWPEKFPSIPIDGTKVG